MSAKSILGVAAGSVLLLSAIGCLGLWSAEQQAMECCATMPCTPENRTQACCKMVQGQAPYYQPVARVFLQPPIDIAVVTAPQLALSSFSAVIARPVDPNGHAPPRDLYTVYLSLLI